MSGKNRKFLVTKMPARVVTKTHTESTTTHALSISKAAFWLLAKQQTPLSQVEVQESQVIVPEQYIGLPKRVAIGSPKDSTRRIISPSRVALLTSEFYPRFAQLYFGESLTTENFDDHARALLAASPKFGRQWKAPTKRRLQVKLESIQACLDDYLRDHGDHYGSWKENHHQKAADEVMEQMIEILEKLPASREGSSHSLDGISCESVPSSRGGSSLDFTLCFEELECDAERYSSLDELSRVTSPSDSESPTRGWSLRDQVEVNKKTTKEKLIRKSSVRVVGFRD